MDDDLLGPDRLRVSRRSLLIAGVLAIVSVAVIAVIAQKNSPSENPRQLAQGGDLGSVDDPVDLSERLAPELTEEAEIGGEPVNRPECADSDQALPEDGASLIYSAELTWEGTPAVVLGYRVKGDNLQRLLLVMAEDDCRILVTQSF